MMTRQELIAALEAAKGPSYELDARVLAAFGRGDYHYLISTPLETWHPTASLDAVLTLARNNCEARYMLRLASVALTETDAPYDKWLAIKAALLFALRAMEDK